VFYFRAKLGRLRADMRVGRYHLVNLTKNRYPPIFQGMGTEDEVFHILQVLSFDIKLKGIGLESKVRLLKGKGFHLI
jgi:hypothetical protein